MIPFLVLALLVPTQLPDDGRPPSGRPPAPRIEWTQPPTDWPEAVRGRFRFGYLYVPVDHADSRGPSLRVALAVIPSMSDRPAPDPVVSVAGGPGLPAIAGHMEFRAREPEHPLDGFRARRDLVILDARGHGYSDPARCDELNGKEPLTEGSAAAERLWVAKLRACRERLVAEGVRLETLSSAQVAGDLEYLRRALGAPRLNLVGISYGSRVIAEAVRQFPGSVRAAVFWGPVPAGYFPAPRTEVAGEVLEELFRRCAEAHACRDAYPGLEADHDSILARLGRAPLRIRLPAADPVPDGVVVVDTELMEHGFAQFLMNRRLAAGAPLLMHTLAREGLGLLEEMADGLMRAMGDAGVSATTFLAFWCNDGVVARRNSETLRQRCRALIGDDWMERPAEPLRSDVPALIHTGEIDPRTPPSYAHALADGLARAHVIIEPWYGHERPSACMLRITGNFIENPAAQPIVACLDSIPPIPFVTDVIPSRWTARLATGAMKTPRRLGVPAAAALILLVIPAIGLPVRTVGKRGPGADDRLSALALFLIATVGLALLIGLPAGLFASAQRHPFIPLVGLSSGWSWSLALPWVLLALTPTAAAVVFARRRRHSARIPAPLVWTTLLGSVLVLALWGWSLWLAG